jgi:hypothetical protein
VIDSVAKGATLLLGGEINAEIAQASLEREGHKGEVRQAA